MSVGTDTGFATYRSRTPWTRAKRLFNPWAYLKLFKRLYFTYPYQFRVLVMALALHFRPQSLYLFSGQKIFPGKSGRLQTTTNPLDDFAIDWDRTSDIPPMGHVTVIQKGISFDRSLVNELPGPIYAVNWPEKLDRQDVVYVTADSGHLHRYIAEQMYPILHLEINWIDARGNYLVRDAGKEYETYLDDPRIKRVSIHHKAGPHQSGTPGTSGLACVVVLSMFAEFVEVYGWDFYLTFPAARASYLKNLFRGFVNFPMERQSAFVENTIYNWHYSYRLFQSANLKNHGFLSGLESHPEINRRLDKVFYNV